MLIEEVLKLARFSGIKLINKLAFVSTYIPQILFYKTFNKHKKKIRLINGQTFEYFGNHLNLPFDHLMSHIKSYQKYYKKAEVVFDIGASFGLFSLYVKQFNPKAKIFLFEPSKEVFKLTKQNLSKLGNIFLFNCAVSNQNAKGLFKFDKNYPEGSHLVKKGTEGVSTIEQIRLDDFIKDHYISKISVLKIDTEGFELNVLQGGKNALKITDTIIIETELASSEKLIEILKLFFNFGFKLENLGDFNFDGIKIHSLDLIFTKKSPQA